MSGLRRAEASTRHYERLGETIVRARPPGAPSIVILHRPEARKRSAVLITRYGALVTRYRRRDADWIEVPDGTAHFMEHMLFNRDDAGVFDRFAALGAYVNAWTAPSSTSYMFQTREGWDECLDLLIEFVHSPQFSAVAVERERAVIGQEIHMTRDEPGYAAYTTLLGKLYPRHPAGRDVAGTAESIARVTPDLLARIHADHYRPEDMVLVLAGSVDPESAVERVRAGYVSIAERQGAGQAAGARGIELWKEPDDGVIASMGETLGMDLAVSSVAMGLRGAVPEGGPLERQRAALAVNVALEAALGDSSEAFDRLQRSGVLDDSFTAAYAAETDHAHALFFGETPDPEVFVRGVRETIAELLEFGVDEATLERLKRKGRGEFLLGLDADFGLLAGFSQSEVAGQDYLATAELIDALGAEEVTDAARRYLDLERLCAVKVVPKN